MGSSGQKKTVCLFSGDIKASSGTAFLLPISVSPLDTLKTEAVARLQTWEGCSMLHLIFSHLMGMQLKVYIQETVVFMEPVQENRCL